MIENVRLLGGERSARVAGSRQQEREQSGEHALWAGAGRREHLNTLR